MRFALAILALLPAIGTSEAGPSIPAAAAPGFSDPLSRLRTVGIDTPATAPAPTDSLRAQPEEAPGPAAGTPFTIIGEVGAERLEEPDVDDIADPGDNRFDRQSSAPLDGESFFSSGVTGAPGGRTLADLARNLINQAPAAGGAGGGAGGANDLGAGRINSSLLSAAIETNLTELLISVLNPKFETDGLVTFSLNGFGSFALLSTGETGGIFLVDLEGGTAIKIYDDSGATAQSQGVSGIAQATNVAQPTGSSNGVQRLLDFLDAYILPIATSPITLALVALSLMVWVVWRLSSREP